MIRTIMLTLVFLIAFTGSVTNDRHLYVKIHRDLPQVKQIATIKQKPKLIKKSKVMTFEISAYVWTGKRTASGPWPRVHHTIAASRGTPIGTKIYFPDLKRTYTVEDRGGYIIGNRIDIFVGSVSEAKKIGRRLVKGVIIK